MCLLNQQYIAVAIVIICLKIKQLFSRFNSSDIRVVIRIVKVFIIQHVASS